MKNSYSGIIGLVIILIFGSTHAFPASDKSSGNEIKYYDGQLFTVIGKYHQEKNYVRFPQEYQNKLRKDVWDLGQNSAGISIRFCTNASEITVRWTVMEDNVMDHMPFTGIKGIDPRQPI